MGQAMAAVGTRIAQHIAEKGSENIRPEILEAMGMSNKTDGASVLGAISPLPGKANGK
jgi:limonene 1,2-monooxygenase